jgi:selenocysteine lyase/cysteine desulfurase
MPNFPAVYAIRAGLEYIRSVGVAAIDAATRPLVEACLSGLIDLGVDLLTPNDMNSIAGILAFRHPDSERIHQALHAQNIHVMSHAGRLRIALHGYNRMFDVERLLGAMDALVSRL